MPVKKTVSKKTKKPKITGTIRKKSVPKSTARPKKLRKIGTVYHFTDLPKLLAITERFKAKTPFLKFHEERAPIDPEKAHQLIVSMTHLVLLPYWGNVRFSLDGDKIAKDFKTEHLEWDKTGTLVQKEFRAIAKTGKDVISLTKYCTGVVISLKSTDDQWYSSGFAVNENMDLVNDAKEYFKTLGIPFKTVAKFTK